MKKIFVVYLVLFVGLLAGCASKPKINSNLADLERKNFTGKISNKTDKQLYLCISLHRTDNYFIIDKINPNEDFYFIFEDVEWYSQFIVQVMDEVGMEKAKEARLGPYKDAKDASELPESWRHAFPFKEMDPNNFYYSKWIINLEHSEFANNAKDFSIDFSLEKEIFSEATNKSDSTKEIESKYMKYVAPFDNESHNFHTVNVIWEYSYS